MRSPLYLYHREDDQQIRLDGPSLLVSHRGRAPCRYPLARISRVVVEDSVRIGLDILSCFARWNIPLVIVDGGGRGRVLVQPLWPRSSDFRLETERFIALPDAAERAQAWAYAREQWHMRQVAAQLPGNPAQRLSRTRLRKAPRSARYRLALRRIWHGHLAALVAERLGRQGLPGELAYVQSAGWQPIRWLCDMLIWDMELHLLAVEQSNEFKSLREFPTSSLAVRSFEARAPRLRKLADAEISQLRRWLATQEMAP